MARPTGGCVVLRAESCFSWRRRERELLIRTLSTGAVAMPSAGTNKGAPPGRSNVCGEPSRQARHGKDLAVARPAAGAERTAENGMIGRVRAEPRANKKLRTRRDRPHRRAAADDVAIRDLRRIRPSRSAWPVRCSDDRWRPGRPVVSRVHLRDRSAPVTARWRTPVLVPHGSRCLRGGYGHRETHLPTRERFRRAVFEALRSAQTGLPSCRCVAERLPWLKRGRWIG